MTESNLTTETGAWRARIISDRDGISRILDETHRVAVVGIKPDPPDGPAHDVPAYMQQVGIEIVPVPVYYPELREVLGVPVHRSLETIDGPVDMVQLFRRSEDLPKHLDEILAARPRFVWMQLGIRNDTVAEALARAGIEVVQDRCLMVELARRGR